MTDEDIDAIIEKGERDTEQLNQKLQVRLANLPLVFTNCAQSIKIEAPGWAVRQREMP